MEAVISSPFRFFDLPFELRYSIFTIIFKVDHVIDIDRQYADIRPLLRSFTVSKKFHQEAYATFFSINEFRIFPTNPLVQSKKFKPIISLFSPRYRAALRKLELRLGGFWTQPPKCWKVTDDLGLEDAISMHTLNVFVECDPSQDIFRGFRIAKNFYTDFAGEMLRDVLYCLPALNEIRFDKYPSVTHGGSLVIRLLEEAKRRNVKISWVQHPELNNGLSCLENHQLKPNHWNALYPGVSGPD